MTEDEAVAEARIRRIEKVVADMKEVITWVECGGDKPEFALARLRRYISTEREKHNGTPPQA